MPGTVATKSHTSRYDPRGRGKHTAACTAPRCGYSADYDSQAATQLAARTRDS